MALPSGLTSFSMRELRVRLAISEVIPTEMVDAAFETLLDLLDEAADADEAHASVDDLPGIIKRLEELRVAAVNNGVEKEREADERLERVKKDCAEEIADLRANLEIALERRKAAEEENYRLKEQAERAVAWWKEKVAGDFEAELARGREYGRQQTAALADVERDRDRLHSALRVIADGPPEDAHRKARVALGRDLLEQTGTVAKEGYVPTRAELRRSRGIRAVFDRTLGKK